MSKAIPFRFEPPRTFHPCKPEEATHLKFKMPGPIGFLLLPVMTKGRRAGTGNWTWNGSVDAPTLYPSIKTTTHGAPPPGSTERTTIICHSWVNDGKVQFLPDTTHELRNKTVDLLQVNDRDVSSPD